MTHAIELADHAIRFGPVEQTLPALLSEQSFSQVIILVDDNTQALCLPMLLKAVPSLAEAPVIEIASGERAKQLATCEQIWEQLLAWQADRQALLLHLGGGVLCDMGGFAAGVYKRGIAFLHIPTTLLAQVDATVGGKVAVNFQKVKNSIGLFRNPVAVLIDSRFLNTLPQRHLRNGFAEMLKHGLIADPNYWDALQSITDFSAINDQHIARSIEIKRAIVERDPLEKAERKKLNFGHTIGHAIESYSLEKDDAPLLHGEAIAMGMIIEAWLSHRVTRMRYFLAQRVMATIFRYFPKYALPPAATAALIGLLYHDKKREAATPLNFSLLKDIGECVVNQTAQEQLVADALKAFNNWK